MANQASLGRHLVTILDVFSNERLLKISRKMLYHATVAYLKTEVKIVKNNLLYVLHYHYNLIEEDTADCGPRETMNIAFSYFDPDYPEKEFYTTGSECIFFNDPQLIHEISDTYKKLLLKKFTLLSFINEYASITTFDQNSKDIISDQLKRIKEELLFRFNNVFTGYGFLNDNDGKHYVEHHKSDYPVKSLEYKSNYIAWDNSKVDSNDEKLLKIEIKQIEPTLKQLEAIKQIRKKIKRIKYTQIKI